MKLIQVLNEGGGAGINFTIDEIDTDSKNIVTSLSVEDYETMISDLSNELWSSHITGLEPGEIVDSIEFIGGKTILEFAGYVRPTNPLHNLTLRWDVEVTCEVSHHDSDGPGHVIKPAVVELTFNEKADQMYDVVFDASSDEFYNDGEFDHVQYNHHWQEIKDEFCN